MFNHCWVKWCHPVPQGVAVWTLTSNRRGSHWWNATSPEASRRLRHNDPCFMLSLSAITQNSLAHTGTCTLKHALTLQLFICYLCCNSSPPLQPRDFHMTALICGALLYLHLNTFFTSGRPTLSSDSLFVLCVVKDVGSPWGIVTSLLLIDSLLRLCPCLLPQWSHPSHSNKVEAWDTARSVIQPHPVCYHSSHVKLQLKGICFTICIICDFSKSHHAADCGPKCS